MGVVLGVQLLFVGVVRIWAVRAFVLPRRTRYLGYGLGVLSIAAALACLVRPALSLIVLALLVGGGWLANGFAEIVSSAAGTTADRGFALMTGVLSAVAGLVILFAPRPTLAA